MDAEVTHFLTGSRRVAAAATSCGLLLADPAQNLLAAVDDAPAEGEAGRPDVCMAPISKCSQRYSRHRGHLASIYKLHQLHS